MRTVPIIFSGPMVRALLMTNDHNNVPKTQTRRIPTPMWRKVQPGDLLWVRETWCRFPDDAPDGMGEATYYRATGTNTSRIAEDVMKRNGVSWKPSIHMPRWASRITLEVTGVIEQPLQDITDSDARFEGIANGRYAIDARASFAKLWDSLHGQKPGEAWADNPVVIAFSFAVHKMNVDELVKTRGDRVA